MSTSTALPGSRAPAATTGLSGILTRRVLPILPAVLLTLFSVIVIGPFFYMISVSLMAREEVMAFPTPLLPASFQFVNYPNAWTRIRFPVVLFNTAFVTVVTVGVGLFLQSLAAYAFARLHFRGRDLVFVGVLGTMMIPRQVIMIPVYIICAHWPLVGGNDIFGVGGRGLLNSYWAIIIPTIVGQSAFSIFLLRQSFMGIPQELEDAAWIDGASTWRVIFQLFLPLSVPVLATLTVLHFIGVWNDFLWPLIVINNPDLYTLTVAINILQGQFGITDWHIFMACTTLATFPVFLIYVFSQQYIIRGITITGMKG